MACIDIYGSVAEENGVRPREGKQPRGFEVSSHAPAISTSFFSRQRLRRKKNKFCLFGVSPCENGSPSL